MVKYLIVCAVVSFVIGFIIGVKMIKIKCLDDGAEYWFLAATPYEAMTKMLYVLELFEHDAAARINKTESGLHLWLEHNDKTYAVSNI